MENSEHFFVGREKRENHEKNEKAILYKVSENGQKIKYGVWKPGCDAPKLGIKYIPKEVFIALKKEKESIEAEEIARGVADY